MYQDCFFFQGLSRISSFLLRNPCYAFCWSSETNTNNDNLSTHLFVWIIDKARASFLLMWEAANTIKSWFWSHKWHGEVIIKRCRKMCHRPGRQHVRIARFSPTENLYVESTRLSWVDAREFGLIYFIIHFMICYTSGIGKHLSVKPKSGT